MTKIQLNIRIDKKDKDRIEHLKSLNGYSSVTSYIIDSAMNRVNKNRNKVGKVVTLSLSPAVDYIIDINRDELLTKTPNKFRTEDRKMFAAGKGIHESIIMDSFGMHTLSLYYAGGFTGDFIEKNINKLGLDGIRFESHIETRVNLKLNIGKNNKKNIELSEVPPKVNDIAKEKILKTIYSLTEEDTLSIAGSFNEHDSIFIDQICALSHDKNIELVLDLSSPIMIDLLKYKPYLIKPNHNELEIFFKTKIETEKDIMKHMMILKEKGAKNIVVTMSGAGSLLLDENGNFYKATIIKKVKSVSPQGAGDSFIGAFLSKRGIENISNQFKWGNAAGAATASNVGLANIEQIKNMYSNIKIEKI